MYIMCLMPLTVKMECRRDAPVEGDSEVAAYLPYNGQASGDRLIPFELADQHDIPVWKGNGHQGTFRQRILR